MSPTAVPKFFSGTFGPARPRLVSAAADGTPAAGGINWNGGDERQWPIRRFCQHGDQLDGKLQRDIQYFNIYRKDLQTGAIALVSVARDGINVRGGDCSDPVVSADGRYVAFQSTAR